MVIFCFLAIQFAVFAAETYFENSQKLLKNLHEGVIFSKCC